jgi:hypothetical protein
MAPRDSSRRSGKAQHSLHQEDRRSRVRKDVTDTYDSVERPSDADDIPQRAEDVLIAGEVVLRAVPVIQLSNGLDLTRIPEGFRGNRHALVGGDDYEVHGHTDEDEQESGHPPVRHS